MRMQWYWPNCWKIWPSYTRDFDQYYQVDSCCFCFGAFQCRWYAKHIFRHLERSEKWSKEVKKLLLEELSAIKTSEIRTEDHA